MDPGLGSAVLKLAVGAAREGVDVLGKTWSLVEKNRPVYQMNVEFGGGVHVFPEGVPPSAGVPFPEMQVKRFKDYTSKFLITLVSAQPRASWFCVAYDGALFIKDAVIDVAVHTVRPGNQLSAAVRFRAPLMRNQSPFPVAALPLDITMEHSHPLNKRVSPTA